MGNDNEQALRLYDEELKNNPNNYTALGYRGKVKLDLAKEKNNKKLLKESKIDFEKAIAVMKQKKYLFPNMISNNYDKALNTTLKSHKK
jgi:tetratricopeptide (TPR) repeat protein